MKRYIFNVRQWILPLLLIPALGFSESPTFTNLTLGDFDKIVKELSGNFSYSTVNSASSLGFLGFELGAVAGITKTPEILRLVKVADPNTKMKDKFPHGGALARLGLPYGITAESVFIPKVKVSKVNMGSFGLSGMWTITDVFFQELPVKVATKGYYSKTSFDYKQNVTISGTSNNIESTINFDESILGAQLLVSKKLLVFDPYLGFGYAKAKGELKATASTVAQIGLFSFPYTIGQTVSSKPKSTQLLAGVDVQLLFFSLGAEYQRSFGTTSYTGRLSFRF